MSRTDDPFAQASEQANSLAGQSSQTNNMAEFKFNRTLLQRAQAAMWTAINNMAQAYDEIKRTRDIVNKIVNYKITFAEDANIQACYGFAAALNNIMVSFIFGATIIEAQNRGQTENISKIMEVMNALLIPTMDENGTVISMEEFLTKVEDASEEEKNFYNQLEIFFSSYDGSYDQSLIDIVTGDGAYSLTAIENYINNGEYEAAIEILALYILYGHDRIGDLQNYYADAENWDPYSLCGELQGTLSSISYANKFLDSEYINRLESVLYRLQDAGMLGGLVGAINKLPQRTENLNMWGNNVMSSQAVQYGWGKVGETYFSLVDLFFHGLEANAYHDLGNQYWYIPELSSYYYEKADQKYQEAWDAFCFDETGQYFSVLNLSDYENYMANTFANPEYGFLSSEYLQTAEETFKQTNETITALTRITSVLIGAPWLGYMSAVVHGVTNGAFTYEMESNYGNPEAAAFNAVLEFMSVAGADAIDMWATSVLFAVPPELDSAPSWFKPGGGYNMKGGLKFLLTYLYKFSENLGSEISSDMQEAFSSGESYVFSEHTPEYASTAIGTAVQTPLFWFTVTTPGLYDRLNRLTGGKLDNMSWLTFVRDSWKEGSQSFPKLAEGAASEAKYYVTLETENFVADKMPFGNDSSTGESPRWDGSVIVTDEDLMQLGELIFEMDEYMNENNIPIDYPNSNNYGSLIGEGKGE